MAWSLRSAADGSRINSSSAANDSRGGTRLIRAIQTVRFTLINRLKELRRNLPVKLFFFLVGFYCATAFATVIGQTGDWDVLCSALAVALVEGIGALMYKYSLNFVDNIKNLIIIFNYWKAGLVLDLHRGKETLSKATAYYATSTLPEVIQRSGGFMYQGLPM